MRGLRHRHPVAGIDRAAEPEAARKFRGEIGEDVAEHVGAEQHVEPLGLAHEQRGGGIDMHVVRLDIGPFSGNFVGHPLEEAVRVFQHVRLVDDRHLAPPVARRGEGGPGDTLGALAGDLADREPDILGRHEFARACEHVAVGVEALGILARHQQVHAGGERRHALERPARTHVGVEFQPRADGGARVDAALLRRRVGRRIDRAEDRQVRRAHRRLCGIRPRCPVPFQRIEADAAFRELQSKREADVQRFQRPPCRRRDLGTDAVARKDQNLHWSFASCAN